MSDDDPDETEGRRLYRARADSLAHAEAAMAARRVQMTDQPNPPPELDAMARKVLSYKPKPKSKPAKARKRRAAKIAKEK